MLWGCMIWMRQNPDKKNTQQDQVIHLLQIELLFLANLTNPYSFKRFQFLRRTLLLVLKNKEMLYLLLKDFLICHFLSSLNIITGVKRNKYLETMGRMIRSSRQNQDPAKNGKLSIFSFFSRSFCMLATIDHYSKHRLVDFSGRDLPNQDIFHFYCSSTRMSGPVTLHSSMTPFIWQIPRGSTSSTTFVTRNQ